MFFSLTFFHTSFIKQINKYEKNITDSSYVGAIIRRELGLCHAICQPVITISVGVLLIPINQSSYTILEHPVFVQI